MQPKEAPAFDQALVGKRIEVLWKTPLQRPTGTDIRPSLPDGCNMQGEPVAGVEGTGATLRFAADCGEPLVAQRFAARRAQSGEGYPGLVATQAALLDELARAIARELGTLDLDASD